MPKRLRDDELAAARAAGLPPRSEDYPKDDSAWQRAQDEWLSSWQPETTLPPPEDKKRRQMWDVTVDACTCAARVLHRRLEEL